MKILITAIALFVNINLFSQAIFNPKSADLVEKVRRPNVAWSYTAATVNVGAGQTYATITAAASAAVTGGTVLIWPGTYITGTEAGGYLLINDVSKRLKFKAAMGYGTVFIKQTSAATYGVRLRTCNQNYFQDLIFLSDQANTTIAVNFNTASSPVTAVFDNCDVQNTSGTPQTCIGMDAPANTGYLEVKNCRVGTVGNPFTSIRYSSPTAVTDANSVSFPNPILITNSIIGSTYWDDCAVNITMYNTQVVQNNNVPDFIWGIGANVAAPVNVASAVDIRECLFVYGPGVTIPNSHGVLLGRGTKNVYFVRNKIIQPQGTNANMIGLVIKCTPAALYGVIIQENEVIAPRTIYIKGGQNCIIKGNITTSVFGDATDGYGFEYNNPNNPDGVISSTGNQITFNKFVGRLGGIKAITTSPATSVATTLATCTFNNNIWQVSAGSIYLNNDGATVTFANRGSIASGFDWFSTFTTF